MQLMTRKITLGLLLIISMFVTDVLASKVNSLDIKVKLYSNGNADIVERWDIDVDDDDAQTEWFVAHRGLGDMRIEQLSVKGYIPGKEGLQPYQTLSSWDADASRKEKAGKCGLYNNGQEICWGFGDYGRHEYVVSYTLTNLVKSYDTNDGFNHCFVDMDCTIKQANVTITAEDSIQLSESNTRHWAFGYEGRFEFIGDSCLVADSQGKLSSSKRMILLLEFDKGLFQPAAKANEPWADKKKRALEGSDYETDDLSFWEWVLAIGIVLVCVLLYFFVWPILTFFGYLLLGICSVLFWIFSLSPLRTKLRRRKLGIVDGRYFRDVKKDWTLPMNKMLVDDLSYFSGMDEQHVIGALLLKLMSRGDLTITREKYNDELQDMLKILNPIEKIDQETKGDDRLCQHVLRLLTMASGKDLVLQPTEFKSWCKKKDNVAKVKDFMNLLETKPDKKYIEKNAADLYGLKAFLKDFSLLNERKMMEVKLWDKYMVYAEFFGIADQVRKDMKEICPEYLEMSKLAQSIDVAEAKEDVVYMFSDAIYSSANDAIAMLFHRKSSGSDGHGVWSSLDGGGGYSGGGGGGGR